MFNPLNMNAPYAGDLQFLQNWEPYGANAGVDALLDIYREIQESGNYFWQGVAIPASANTTVPALQTINGTAQIADGSYITAINFFFDPTTNPEGFKFKLYDQGTKASIFYGEYALERVVASSMHMFIGQGASNPPSDAGMNDDTPFGPGLLTSPLIVTKPGVIGWEIVNQSSADAMIQLMLAVAVPITQRTINQVVVSK